MIRSTAAAFFVLTLAGCSPRIDRLDVFSGSRGARPTTTAPPSAGSPVTVRVEISPRQTNLEAPTITLQPLRDAAPGPAAGIAGRLTLTSDGDSSPAPYAITIPADGQPALPYGSTWGMDLAVPYRSLGRPGVLNEHREFTVRAPASCAAFDNGIQGWSIPENRMSYGASLEDIHRWPQDTQVRFLTSVSLEPDAIENFPRKFAAAPDVLFGSARITIGGDHPEKFREWLVRNPYINDKNHWIAQVETASLLTNAITVQMKTDAAHPLHVRARAYCTIPGTDNAPCDPDHADSAEASVAPTPDWQTVRLSVDTKVFPERHAAGIGHLLILGDPGDSEKHVWIDMVCPDPLR